jgi:PAS domain S-box-containing protein
MAVRPRILACLPPDWDAARLLDALSGTGRHDVVQLPGVSSALATANLDRVDAAVLGWPVPGQSLGSALDALAGLPAWPVPVLLVVPPAELPRVEAGAPAEIARLHAVVPAHPGHEKLVARLVADVVEKEQHRARVEQSVRQYADLLQNTQDAIYVLGPTRFAFVNRAFEDLLGFPSPEVCSPEFDWQRLVSPESRPLIQERSRLAARGEPLPPRYEFVAVTKSGARLDVSASVSYIDYNGEPCSLGVLQDITARKQYERALLRRNRELSVLNDIAATVSRAPDLGTVLNTAVERLIAVMGFNVAGIYLVEKGREVLRAQRHRGVRAAQAEQASELALGLTLVRAAVATGDVQVVRDMRLDARTRASDLPHGGFLSAVCVPIQAKERVLGAAVGLGVAPRDFAPEEMSLLLSLGHQLGTAVERASLYDRQEAAVQRMVVLDEVAQALSSTLEQREVFLLAAERILKVLGADDVELSLLRAPPEGPRRMEVVLHVDRHGHREEPARLVGEGEGLRWRTLEATRPVLLDAEADVAGADHRARGIRSVAAAPLVVDGQPMGAVLVGFSQPVGRGEAALEFLGPLSAHLALAIRNARVFSELEEAYRELKETKDRLVLQEKLGALGEMSAGVAHDFNNVLGAILGRTQLLKQFIMDPVHRRSLDVIERSALDGAGTVRRIQEFSRARGGDALELVYLDQVVSHAAEMTQPRWQARARAEGVDIQVTRHKGRPPPVLGNPQELREVLTNLVHNACDAMPGGGIIELSTGQEGGRCFIKVADNGTGMPPDVRARVFDPFFTTKGVKGTGLGLSVSYGIIQRHHGEILVESQVGVGTTFTILLDPAPGAPLTYPPEELSTPRHALPAVAPAPPPPHAGTVARVLVIDDEESIRDILADMLRSADHEVIMAQDGAEGLRLLDQIMASGSVDIVLTDLGMPGMTGWEVAATVSARYPQLPLGLITGWGSNIDEEQMRAHGVDLVVPKPFKLSEITRVVEQAVELGRRKRAAREGAKRERDAGP